MRWFLAETGMTDINAEELLFLCPLCIANNVALLEKSKLSERLWLMLHADVRPHLLGVWYRPLETGELDSVWSLETELSRYAHESLGTILVGDLNVHHTRRLRYSSRISAEGAELKSLCDGMGLRQFVDASTGDAFWSDF